MKDLIEKLEQAEVGSREFDALIWLRFNRPEYAGGVKALEMRGWYDGRGHMILETDTGEEVADDLGIGTYTTSLDAALALAERVFPDWDWIIGRTNGGLTIHCQFGGKDYVFGNTPALALCAAILRAQSEARV